MEGHDAVSANQRRKGIRFPWQNEEEQVAVSAEPMDATESPEAVVEVAPPAKKAASPRGNGAAAKAAAAPVEEFHVSPEFMRDLVDAMRDVA